MKPRALLICPEFFGYQDDIAAELQKAGFDVTSIDERPSDQQLVRGIIRIRPTLLRSAIEWHYKNALKKFAHHRFDLVIVVKAEVVPRWFIEALRSRNPSAKFVLYVFDSRANFPQAHGLTDLFDSCFTFDPQDSMVSSDWNYLPLFYTSEFRARGDRKRRWEAAFVGTLHSDRYQFVQSLMSDTNNNYCHLYINAWWLFAYLKYVTGEQREVPWRALSTRKLSREETADVFRQSKAVLDMQRPYQSGLTMRTFEVLASGAILVTTNQHVREASFYDPERVLVVHPGDGRVGARMVRDRLECTEAFDGPPSGFSQYGLRAWIQRLIA